MTIDAFEMRQERSSPSLFHFLSFASISFSIIAVIYPLALHHPYITPIESLNSSFIDFLLQLLLHNLYVGEGMT